MSGSTGPTGPTGPSGQNEPNGPRGPRGPTEPTEPTVPIGPIGSTVPIGLIGPTGPNGSSGPTGPKESTEQIKQRLINRDIVAYDPLMTTIRDSLWKMRTQHSTSIDIISVYLKGQKILYIEAKVYCEHLLYAYMLPTLAITSICTVLSLALDATPYGSIIVASLAAINSFLLAIISFLKMDAKAESYRISAYRFDKLQTKCEFFSGQLLFSGKTIKAELNAKVNLLEQDDGMDTFMGNLEKEIIEIKEVNQFVLPQYVRHMFPKLYTTNIFAEIKLRHNTQRVYIYDLNTMYNDIAELMNRPQDEATKQRLEILKKEKENLMTRIIRTRDSYLTIDRDFTKEINASIYRSTYVDCILCRRKQRITIAPTPQYESDMNMYLHNKKVDAIV